MFTNALRVAKALFATAAVTAGLLAVAPSAEAAGTTLPT